MVFAKNWVVDRFKKEVQEQNRNNNSDSKLDMLKEIHDEYKAERKGDIFDN